MNILTAAVPAWLSIAFIFAILVPVWVMGKMAFVGATKANLDNPQKYQKMTYIFLIGFFIYASAMSFTGIFQQNTLPPKIFLFTTIPLLIFYNIISRVNAKWSDILANIPLATLIRFHIIRFIGIFFLLTYAYGALPKYFAITGGIGDIVAAISAIFVANYAAQAKPNYKIVVVIWNIVGLLDILNVIAAGLITTKLALANGTQGVLEIANFPFCLIPAFAPATILFLHICIFKKLKTVH
jgi:hypothetical protein